MQPSQNLYTPENDPYAFLNQAGRTGYTNNPLRKLFSAGSGSFSRKLLLVGVGTVIIIVFILILKAVVGSGGNINMPSLYAVLGEEQEIINLSQAGQQSSNQANLNFSYTALGSLITDQSSLINLLKNNGISVSQQQMVLQPSADAELNQSQSSGDFDTVYVNIMQNQLKLYETDLSNAYALSNSALLKSYFKQDYNTAVLLLKMLNNAYV
jgi:predicted outer membrane protein